MLHIQQKKCILKRNIERNGRREGNYLWQRQMREIQSADKIEGSSSDAAQLRTEFEMVSKGTRGQVACSLIINQLSN